MPQRIRIHRSDVVPRRAPRRRERFHHRPIREAPDEFARQAHLDHRGVALHMPWPVRRFDQLVRPREELLLPPLDVVPIRLRVHRREHVCVLPAAHPRKVLHEPARVRLPERDAVASHIVAEQDMQEVAVHRHPVHVVDRPVRRARHAAQHQPLMPRSRHLRQDLRAVTHLRREEPPRRIRLAEQPPVHPRVPRDRTLPFRLRDERQDGVVLPAANEFDLPAISQLAQPVHHVAQPVVDEHLREHGVHVDRHARLRVREQHLHQRPVRLVRDALHDLVRLRRRLIEVQKLGPRRHARAPAAAGWSEYSRGSIPGKGSSSSNSSSTIASSAG